MGGLYAAHASRCQIHNEDSPMAPKDDAEQIELEWKRLQIEELREKLQARRDEIARLERLRAAAIGLPASQGRPRQQICQRQRCELLHHSQHVPDWRNGNYVYALL
jgi:small-conductance mechanosensitive channel